MKFLLRILVKEFVLFRCIISNNFTKNRTEKPATKHFKDSLLYSATRLVKILVKGSRRMPKASRKQLEI